MSQSDVTQTTERRMIKEDAFELTFDRRSNKAWAWSDFMAEMSVQFEKHVPAGYRNVAQVRMNVDFGWDAGDADPKIEVFYMRPETDQEMLERRASEQRADAERVLRDLEQLHALEAKYRNRT